VLVWLLCCSSVHLPFATHSGMISMNLSPQRGLLAAFAALALTAGATPVAAQSDILLQLRSGSPQGDRFRIDSAGGVVALGQLGIGIIPASGCGYRMMWYPYRGSFRAGSTADGGACNYWDDANHGFYSWAGGNLTTASQYATFAFGDQARATAIYAVAFGNSTQVSGSYGFGAGYQSRCSGTGCSAVGYLVNAAGQGAVALGFRSTADADYSVAIGHRASTNGHTGSFVISDASTTDSTEANANNQFMSRFAGGYRLFTNSSETLGVSIAASGNSWASISDRNRKENIVWLDGEDVLRRLRSVPVASWNYIGIETGARNIGPMAQDWHAAFPLNSDSLTINQADFDGVNLAAVQALERRTAEQAARIQELEAAQARQAAEILELHALVRSLAEQSRP
jgi:trimeric autotransporter adhesin